MAQSTPDPRLADAISGLTGAQLAAGARPPFGLAQALRFLESLNRDTGAHDAPVTPPGSPDEDLFAADAHLGRSAKAGGVDRSVTLLAPDDELPAPPPLPPSSPDADPGPDESVGFAEASEARFDEPPSFEDEPAPAPPALPPPPPPPPGSLDAELAEFTDFDETFHPNDSAELDDFGLGFDDLLLSGSAERAPPASGATPEPIEPAQGQVDDPAALFEEDDAEDRGGRHDRDVRSSVKRLFGKK